MIRVEWETTYILPGGCKLEVVGGAEVHESKTLDVMRIVVLSHEATMGPISLDGGEIIVKVNGVVFYHATVGVLSKPLTSDSIPMKDFIDEQKEIRKGMEEAAVAPALPVESPKDLPFDTIKEGPEPTLEVSDVYHIRKPTSMVKDGYSICGKNLPDDPLIGGCYDLNIQRFMSVSPDGTLTKPLDKKICPDCLLRHEVELRRLFQWRHKKKREEERLSGKGKHHITEDGVSSMCGQLPTPSRPLVMAADDFKSFHYRLDHRCYEVEQKEVCRRCGRLARERANEKALAAARPLIRI